MSLPFCPQSRRGTTQLPEVPPRRSLRFHLPSTGISRRTRDTFHLFVQRNLLRNLEIHQLA